MTQKQAIQLFEDRKVRTVWDERTETWYFSVLSWDHNVGSHPKAIY